MLNFSFVCVLFLCKVYKCSQCFCSPLGASQTLPAFLLTDYQNISVLYRLMSATKQNAKSVDANLWLGQVCYLMLNKDKETAKYLLTVRI